ncbi:hypothetical protein GCM10010156_75440 [Planobispora rosea]|uniref:Uncharacterized protein n=1 Tax=Planobispora rosea TaxID=35762 RepID=A0A8J3WGC0_PLARO|nr:hypothetical protein [Planobispora rosea]GGT07053.1 hypothetical protein GCM10010156_75440 [Planobispora rosea]GIH89149.1 hypothetical protein Pro02_75570 [Planobispora rosea]
MIEKWIRATALTFALCAGTAALAAPAAADSTEVTVTSGGPGQDPWRAAGQDPWRAAGQDPWDTEGQDPW